MNCVECDKGESPPVLAEEKPFDAKKWRREYMKAYMIRWRRKRKVEKEREKR